MAISIVVSSSVFGCGIHQLSGSLEYILWLYSLPSLPFSLSDVASHMASGKGFPRNCSGYTQAQSSHTQAVRDQHRSHTNGKQQHHDPKEARHQNPICRSFVYRQLSHCRERTIDLTVFLRELSIVQSNVDSLLLFL